MSVLLDDFEDQNNHAPGDGWWYAEDDRTGPTATLTFEAAGREDSAYAARVRGGPYTQYGAFLGLDLPGGVYDASAFVRLCFFGRADPPMELSAQLLDTVTVHYALSVDLTESWQEYCPALVDFAHDGAILDLTSLIHIQFWQADPSRAFEFWIDDVTLKR
jgi:hypothetical protein